MNSELSKIECYTRIPRARVYGLAALAVSGLLFIVPAPSSAQSAAAGPIVPAQKSASPARPQNSDPHAPGRVTGVVADDSGTLLEGVKVTLTREGSSQNKQEVVSGEDGQFTFDSVPPGPFQISVEAEGFTGKPVAETLHPGETVTTPQITLTIAAQKQEVTVSAGFEPVEVAEFQIQDEEKQRILGIVPNFYVSYVHDAVPLHWKQKYSLAWKSSIDPFTIIGTASYSAIQQADDELNGYGQGMEGYGKRYGANYGDVVIGTYLGSAVLPSLLRQDPRYFYKGEGTKKSRVLYALASPFVAKGDDGKWQPNYSYVAGNFAAAAISNQYYPANDRTGINSIAGTAMIRFGENALSSVLQEFVIRHFERHLPPSGSQ